MIKAMFLSLLGATFEVRQINMKTGKDIPGRCLAKGGYFKCRKVFRAKNLKYGMMLRLQAVDVMQHRANTERPSDLLIVDEASDVTPEMLSKAKQIATGIEQASHLDIGDSNARQSKFYEENPGSFEPYRGDDKDDHKCDSLGAMEFDDHTETYVSTCAVCGRTQ